MEEEVVSPPNLLASRPCLLCLANAAPGVSYRTEATDYPSSSLDAHKSSKAEDGTKDTPNDAADVVIEQSAGSHPHRHAHAPKQHKRTHHPSPQLLNYLNAPATEDPYTRFEDSGWANAISQRMKYRKEVLDAEQKECEKLAAANNK